LFLYRVKGFVFRIFGLTLLTLMKKNWKLIPILLLSPIALSGCSIFDLFSTNKQASNGASINSGNGFYSIDTVTPFTYRDIQKSATCDAVPSVGTYNLLVLPIELTGYSFSSQTLKDLDVCLNGSGSSDTGYWESLSSFYKKSSYGKLNLNYTVAPKYAVGLTPSQLYQKNTSSAVASTYCLTQVVANYKKVSGTDCTQFDNDGDGAIDGVIMVYSCPDVSRSSAIARIDPNNDLFWAYTYWDYQHSSSYWTKSNPMPNVYFWMSYDFIYEQVTSPKVDPHTLIHESGHMLGLDDYYSGGSSSDSNYNPMGGWAMMDENILDHDIFSKMALGWTTPYVVTGACTLEINPSETSGDCILIAPSSWNQTAFDEYLLLELYTPTDLNYLDSHTQYSSREKHYTTYGVKLYHVDARVVGTSDFKSWTALSGTTLTGAGVTKAYEVAASNCYKNTAKCSSDYSLIRMISADNVNTFTNGQLSDESSLFETGDSFSMSTYSKYFPNKTKLDSGKSLGYSISFDEVTDSKARITFKVA
jgi:M6 family metalloprotease-like protein